jgi:type IV fimbrial biogenesis protein FimT
MRTARGVGLLELVVVLAIAAILAGLAAPGLGSLLARRALVQGAGDLYDSINFARSQALARGARVVLAAPAGSADLARGWTVFVDADGDGHLGAAETVLQQHPALAAGIVVAARFSQAGGYVAYNGAGRSCSTASSAAARPGTLTLTREPWQRRITIGMLGRARICASGADAGRATACAD